MPRKRSFHAFSENQIAAEVALALHNNYSGINSAVKVIGLKTGAHPRAIRNWYEGLNAPSSYHLILLAQQVPSLAEVFLRLAGLQDIWTAYKMVMDRSYMLNALPPDKAIQRYLTDKTVSINISLPPKIAGQLNQRQLWFLGRLQQGIKSKAHDIVHVWEVSTRTAWRDLATLEDMGLMRLSGSKKTGNYVLILDLST